MNQSRCSCSPGHNRRYTRSNKKHIERGQKMRTSSSPPGTGSARRRRKLGALISTGLAVSLSMVAGTAVVSGATTVGAAAQQPLVVWVDATRVPFVKAYEKAFPNVKIDLVTYDG